MLLDLTHLYYRDYMCISVWVIPFVVYNDVLVYETIFSYSRQKTQA